MAGGESFETVAEEVLTRADARVGKEIGWVREKFKGCAILGLVVEGQAAIQKVRPGSSNRNLDVIQKKLGGER